MFQGGWGWTGKELGLRILCGWYPPALPPFLCFPPAFCFLSRPLGTPPPQTRRNPNYSKHGKARATLALVPSKVEHVWQMEFRSEVLTELSPFFLFPQPMPHITQRFWVHPALSREHINSEPARWKQQSTGMYVPISRLGLNEQEHVAEGKDQKPLELER